MGARNWFHAQHDLIASQSRLAEDRAVTEPLKLKPHYLTVRGCTKTVSEWSRHTGVHIATISQRLQKGWTPAKAIRPPKARTKP